MTAKNDKKWYFNTRTEQAELGPKSPISERMGPYDTEEDALNAWKIVEERNRKWEEQDRGWR
ncbi:hypothetical protein [Bifidobacterium callimiconis]|nr:hypothetical protein [Bifidobacterium callimiconis]MBT1176870.1 hypothetical protein [Bifidobacterium callimiconis]